MPNKETLETFEYLYKRWLKLLEAETDTERMMFILDKMSELDRKIDELKWGDHETEKTQT